MSYLYVLEQGASINFKANRFEVHYKDGMVKSIPAETLDMIEVFGNVKLTTPCIQSCLQHGVNVAFFSSNGAYFGRLISTNHVNVHRQKLQARLCQDEEFKLSLSRGWIDAKINNQIVILRRYGKNYDVDNCIKQMKIMQKKVNSYASNLEELIGYEGTAARLYFQQLGKLVNPEFAFSKRSRRPPLDPYNSLISLGYSLIMNEIYGKLEGKGLNPYFGFLHKDREKHPTLASDLMEEWRAVMVDSIALAMLNGKELVQESFYQIGDTPGVFLTKDAFKKYVGKLENKLKATSQYLSYIDYGVSFRRAMDLQIEQLIKAMEEHDASLYQPIKVR